MHQNYRVLGRKGARELALDEVMLVTGAYNTFVCSFPLPPLTHTGPGAGDGDACGNGDIDNG